MALNAASDDGLVPQAVTVPDAERPLRLQAMRRFVLTLPSYVLALAVLYLGAAAHRVPMERAHWMALLIGTGLGLFGWLIQSGTTLKWRDPLAVFPQVLFGVLVISSAYHWVELSRSVAFMWLAIIVVYDMRRLPMTQVVSVIGMATACQLIHFTSIWRTHPTTPALIDELLNLGCLALLLPTLVMVSTQARALVRRRQQQNLEREDTLETLRFLSEHDTLTGLHNRRHMLASLAREAEKTKRFGMPFTVALLDIDFFKQVNDAHGHAVGDAVLKSFAGLAAQTLNRPLDLVARWGGEEFMVLFPESDATDAYPRIQALRLATHAHDWSAICPGLRVRFSAGLAECRDGDLEKAIGQADRCLYDAKDAGRDCVRPWLSSEAHQRNTVAATALAVHGIRLPSPRSTRAPSPLETTPLHRSGGRSSIARPLVRWLLTDDPKTRALLKLAAFVSVMYLFWLGAVFLFALPRHMFPGWLNAILVCHLAIGAFAPLVIIRSGWSKNFKDPVFLMEQCMWANMMLVAASMFSPVGKGALLGVLCQVQVFGFPSFSPTQARRSGFAVMFMLAMAWLGMALWAGPGFDALSEGFRTAMACSVVWMLTAQSHNHAILREKSRQERKELESAIYEVRHITTTDSLTGLRNRQHLHELLDSEVKRRHPPGFCIALIDLDHFKRINDTWGHQVGDEVLANFARMAKRSFRTVDTVGRWGGEEFLVVMPGGTQAPIDHLRQEVATANLSIQAPGLRVTLSAGLAFHKPEEDWADTLERADRALYAAKQEGRNRCKTA